MQNSIQDVAEPIPIKYSIFLFLKTDGDRLQTERKDIKTANEVIAL